MVPTAVAAGLGGHRLHAMHHHSAHSLGGEAMCPDTLTSTRDGNSEKLDQTWILPDPSLEGSSHDVSKGVFASSARNVGQKSIRRFHVTACSPRSDGSRTA